MPLCRVGTGATCVVAVEAEAMCPTVVHVETIVGEDRSRASGLHWSIGRRSRWLGRGGYRHDWRFDKRCMGAVEANLARGELAHPLFVFTCEVFTKFDEGLRSKRAYTPGVAGRGEHTCGLEHDEGEVFDGIVSQGVAAGDGDALDFP